MPQVLLSDNRTEYVNNAFQGLTETYEIVHTFTPVYHLQADPVERVNINYRDEKTDVEKINR